MIFHRAVGVEYRQRGSVRTALGGQILLCGGAINSPQLLQISGVGNAAETATAGIEPVHDLRGVGENLQDHLEVYIQHACKQPVSMAAALKKQRWPWIAYRWLVHRSGPGSTNHFEAGGFIRGNDEVRYPNIMFHFLPLAIRYDGTAPCWAQLSNPRRAYVLELARIGQD